MEKHERKERGPAYLKRKLTAALSMLLVSSILMGTTTYAWLVMSTAPEVTGITTNVGANGSLEIALLNSTTYQDLSQIRTTVGDSLANRVLNQDNPLEAMNPAAVATANNTWGNLIDLGYPGYGLGEITLLPTRLQVSGSEGAYRVSNGLLSVPVYGYDGRIMELEKNTYSTTYRYNLAEKMGQFAYMSKAGEDGKKTFEQGYGVRAIGTSNSLSVQAAALSSARNLINTYTGNARTAAKNAFDTYGGALSAMLVEHAADGATTYDNADVTAMKGLLNGLQSSVDYIDLAIRQGMIAVAASKIADKTLFEAAQSIVNSTEKSLSQVVAELEAQQGGIGTLPEEFDELDSWIDDLAAIQNDLDYAETGCNGLTDGEHTWAEVKEILDYVMNTDGVYIGEKKFSDFSKDDIGLLLGGEVVLTLGPGSGIPADIADFADDYETMLQIPVNAAGISLKLDATITTSTIKNPTYLAKLYGASLKLNAAGGEGGGAGQDVVLSSTYGYALDMAFRCNAATSDLLLQTAPMARVTSDDVNSPNIMGGGSYMEFGTQSKSFTMEQMILLMDAIRVGFLDNTGNILGIAKLNTSNRVTVNGTIKAPLYLYSYEFVEDETSKELMLVMGERQKMDNVITPLAQNTAKAITTLVWLDGDIVDNTMVAADASASLTGTLNLQFSSSADLVPAHNNQLLTASTDKSALFTLIQAAKTEIEAGQRMYTTVSWDAYKAAYTYAVAVNDNANANDIQVYNASLNLMKAENELKESDKTALVEAIAEARKLTGTGEAKGAYVIPDENGNYAAYTAATQEQIDKQITSVKLDKETVAVEIKEVDYKKNLYTELNEAGNEVYEPIYTYGSWATLALALYNAEAVNYDPNADYNQVDAAITALAAAQDALVRNVYFVAYDLNGKLYYYGINRNEGAITDFKDEEDTYGKWYEFDSTTNRIKRIIADKTILDLEAHAEVADIAKIVQDRHISNDKYLKNEPVFITPFVELESDYYSELANEKILAMHWLNPDENLFVQGITQSQIAKLTELKAEAIAVGVDDTYQYGALTVLEAVDKMLTEGLYSTKNADADKLIAALEEDIQEQIEKNNAAAEPEEPENPEEPEEPEEPKPQPEPAMTGDQVKVLLAAINAAKSMDGYEVSTEEDGVETVEEPSEEPGGEPGGEPGAEPSDPEQPAPAPAPVDPLAALREAVAAAEAVLAKGAASTEKEANEVLNALNKELKAKGEREYTIANTILQTIPLTDARQEVVYKTEDPNAVLYLTGETGKTKLGVVILTKSGIVYKTTVDLEIYSAAAGVEIDTPASAPAGGEMVEEKDAEGNVIAAYWDQKMDTGAAVNLGAELYAREEERQVSKEPEIDEETGEPIPVEPETVIVKLPIDEEIKSYTWSTNNTDVVSISGAGDEMCVVAGKAAGTAKISLSVETVQGNTYTNWIVITVNAPPAPEEPTT